MLARLRSLARTMFRRSEVEADLRDELEFHLQERADHFEEAGLERSDAVRLARVEFGGVESCKERCREARGARWLDEASRNLVYALRSMRKSPGFTAVAVLSLALGIGGNLAVFGFLHRLILAKLPVQNPDGLYQVVVVSGSGKSYTHSHPKFEVLRDSFPFFDPLFAFARAGQFDMTIGSGKRSIVAGAVTENYFEALGLRPALGSLPAAADGRARLSEAAVLSYDFWRNALHADPAVIGTPVTLAGARADSRVVTFVVAGVAPADFNGTESGVSPDLYLTLGAYERVVPGVLQRPNMAWLHVMTRLAPGVPLATAQSIVAEKWQQIDEPNRVRRGRSFRDSVVLEDGSRGFSGVRLEFSRAVIVLMGLVGAVFLIACANLATLLFVRGAGRLRETSVRLALGASRAQLVRQWMTECLLLAVVGGLAGLLMARSITDLLLQFVSEGDRQWLRFEARPVVLLTSVGLTLAAGVLFGLLPGLRATQANPEAALRSQSGSVTPRRGLLTEGVLAGQLAVSLVLVVGAALFARTLWNLNTASGGFDRKTVAYAAPRFGPGSVPPPRRAAVMNEVFARLARSPFVASVGMGNPPMVSGDASWWWVSGADYTPGPDEDNTVYLNNVLPGYFGVLGIPFIEGRDFQDRDRPAAGDTGPGPVVIVNEHLARRYYPGRSALGQAIRLQTDRPWLTIVGVVRNAKNKSLRDDQRDVLYTPLPVDQWNALLVRSNAGVAPTAVHAEIAGAFAAAAKGVPVEIGLLEDAVQRSLGRDRLVAQLSAAFGVLGVVLASIGLYGAIAHSVSSRRREIGIRIAVGATSRDVIWMVMQESLRVTAAGVVVGLPVAFGGSRLVSSLLFDVSPSDPAILAVSAAVLAATGALAGWWPADRAARLDPSQTLRCE